MPLRSAARRWISSSRGRLSAKIMARLMIERVLSGSPPRAQLAPQPCSVTWCCRSMLKSSAWRKARSTYSPPIQRRRSFSPSVYALLFFAGAFLAIASSIGSGNDLEKIAGGIFEVDAAAAEEAVDLAVARLPGVGPVVEAPRLHAPENLVELLLAHEEGVVLHLD